MDSWQTRGSPSPGCSEQGRGRAEASTWRVDPRRLSPQPTPVARSRGTSNCIPPRRPPHTPGASVRTFPPWADTSSQHCEWTPPPGMPTYGRRCIGPRRRGFRRSSVRQSAAFDSPRVHLDPPSLRSKAWGRGRKHPILFCLAAIKTLACSKRLRVLSSWIFQPGPKLGGLSK